MSDENVVRGNPGLALVDPVWNIGTINLGAVRVPMIGLQHPEHGLIHAIVPLETAQVLLKMLTDAIDACSVAKPNVH